MYNFFFSLKKYKPCVTRSDWYTQYASPSQHEHFLLATEYWSERIFKSKENETKPKANGNGNETEIIALDEHY